MIHLSDHPWLALALGTLATYRLSLLVSKEDGPAFIFRKIRKLPDKGTATKKGLSCSLCVSVYASALVSTFYWWRELIAGIDWPLYWLSMSAASICLHMQFTTEIGTKE